MLGCVNEINSGERPSPDDLVVEFFAKLFCMLKKIMNTAQLHIKVYFLVMCMLLASSIKQY